jgi:hypothetical protein
MLNYLPPEGAIHNTISMPYEFYELTLNYNCFILLILGFFYLFVVIRGISVIFDTITARNPAKSGTFTPRLRSITTQVNHER